MAKKEETAPMVEETKASSPWDEMIEITLPRARAGEQNTQFVCVNGRGFQVPKGKPTKVPKPVHEVLSRMLEAADAEDAYIREVDGLNHEL